MWLSQVQPAQAHCNISGCADTASKHQRPALATHCVGPCCAVHAGQLLCVQSACHSSWLTKGMAVGAEGEYLLVSWLATLSGPTVHVPFVHFTTLPPPRPASLHLPVSYLFICLCLLGWGCRCSTSAVMEGIMYAKPCKAWAMMYAKHNLSQTAYTTTEFQADRSQHSVQDARQQCEHNAAQ